MLVNSWSVSVRHMWKLPNETHRFFIEPLAGHHAQNMLITRFVKFIQSIETGHKLGPIYLLETIRKNTMTITGKNIQYICDKLNVENFADINVNEVKKNLKFKEIPENNVWKIDMIKELTNVKMNNLHIPFDDKEELTELDINDIISFIATN